MDEALKVSENRMKIICPEPREAVSDSINIPLTNVDWKDIQLRVEMTSDKIIGIFFIIIIFSDRKEENWAFCSQKCSKNIVVSN